MIFTNGDCSITYQRKETISKEEREKIENEFYRSKPLEYATDIISTDNTFTFLYEPISIMEAHNTIEPSGIVISEVREFLAEKGFEQ